jgi:hypothetical protein
MADASGTSIFNLDDMRKGAVTVTVGNKVLTLAPGRHATITSQLAREFESVNPAESFGYRNLTSTKLNNELQVFSSEFSLSTAINKVKAVRDLISSAHPDAKRMSKHLLKTVASVYQLSKQQAQFHQYQHPRLSAMATFSQ